MTDTYTSPTRLTGKTPGQITSSGKVAGLDKKGTVWIEQGQQPDGSWLYWRKGYAPAVEMGDSAPAPAPVDNSSPVSTKSTQIGNHLFLHNDAIVAGFNAGGGLGTVNQQVPEGWPRVKGRASVGLLRIRDLTEAVAVLTVDETFSVGADGAYDFNGQLVGKVTAPGVWLDGTWKGMGRTGIAIEQQVSLIGGLIRFDIRLTNTAGRALRDVRYKRTVDYDTLTSPIVSPRIAARGSVETVLSNGAVTVLRSDDPRATASFGGFIQESPYAAALDKPQAVGWAGKKEDAGSNLLFRLGDMPAGVTYAFSFDLGFLP